MWGEHQPHEHMWEEDLLKSRHILDCSAALEIINLAALTAAEPSWQVSGCPLLLQADRLQTAREPGKTQKSFKKKSKNGAH